jgi:hypothetical protein
MVMSRRGSQLWQAMASLVLLAVLSLPQQALGQDQTAGATFVKVSSNESAPTYAKDVAPILQENCVRCHRPGEIGPMSLLTYEQAKQYAPLIALKVANRRMPPWHLDKTVGIQDFKDDFSLSDDEIATIVGWVDAGAQRGDLSDLLPPAEFGEPRETWEFASRFGRPPDLIMQNPPFKLPAEGLDQFPTMEAPLEGLDEERWMMAIEAQPSRETRYVFHHGGPSLRQNDERTGLMNSPAGKVGEILPEDTGKLFKPGATVSYSFHLFPVGTEVDVVMKWGVWFYPKGEVPKYETPGEVQFASHPMSLGRTPRAPEILIPPRGHAMIRGVHVLDKPVRIHSIRPHMHMRGMYQALEAVYPDGRSEIINKINFDHRWHTTYTYEDDARPLLPTGTMLIVTTWYDNTDNNPNNPDPDQWVLWGQRSVDDMAHMWVGVTYLPEDDFERMVEERKQRLDEPEAGGRIAQVSDNN